ncbi:MAG: hypothetical protein AMJ90_09390 [candidate division Zixibacteria bacterium SM23_73_2]|nr:MAG: hypothetical protein AMJ90_09390 [candidate division Zixibacteria bacterium SM23_73_2]
MADIILKEVTKTFGKDSQVLENINLEIKNKELFTIVGPSGCGKSTLLNLIAGLEDLSSGEIYFDQKRVDHLPPAKRDVAMVFQSYALYPHKTVFENLAFPLMIKKYPKEKIKSKVKEVAGLLEIEALLRRKPKQLSGGQRQRVALGRAMVRKPRVFLLDEPLSNLDAKLRVYMRSELKRLHSEIKTTMVYVTHDQAEAMSLSERVAILHHKKIQQCDKPEIIYNYPQNKVVAEFVGSPQMNFLEGEIVEKEGGFFIKFNPEDWFPLSKEAYNFFDGEVFFGIRSEDVILNQKEEKGFFKGEIFATEPLGDRTYVDIIWGDNKLKAQARSDFRGKADEFIYFSFESEKIHLFDRKTGESLRKIP